MIQIVNNYEDDVPFVPSYQDEGYGNDEEAKFWKRMAEDVKSKPKRMKVFSGYKKGSAEYNKEVKSKLQGVLFLEDEEV